MSYIHIDCKKKKKVDCVEEAGCHSVMDKSAESPDVSLTFPQFTVLLDATE